MTGRIDDEIEVVVAERAEPALAVALLSLAPVDGSGFPAWEPGAHIDVLLPDGTERQYSLCGDPADTSTWQIAVLREVSGRGGSELVHDRLSQGATVRVRGPRNHFALVSSPRYRFVAGGIGITPLLPMIREADRRQAVWTLDYAGRSLSSMAFAAALTDAYGDRVRLHPADVRRLDLRDLLGEPEPDTLVYACGPTRLLAAVKRLGTSWPADTVRLEHFESVHLHEPQRHDSFEVELADSGLTVTVPPDRSVLEVIEEAGVLVLSSCREGTCGTCETTVLDGIVDHRDSVLTPQEQASNTVMMVCCSRAISSRLVLEL